MSTDHTEIDNNGRRHFLIGVGVITAGAAVGKLYGQTIIEKLGGKSAGDKKPNAANASFQPHAFVRIGSDDQVTIIVGKSEMGQGVHTGLPMILADELDIDPRRVKVEVAGHDKAFYHPFLPAQFTGGSMSIMTTYEPLRKAGATARAMLLSAAAKQWGVPVANLTTDNGVVLGGRRRATYGELAEAASALPVPKDVALKDSKDFKYIGKSLSRLDGHDKVTGRAEFSIDVQRPGMLIAMIARSPVSLGKMKSFDDSAARAVAGVVDVKAVPSGVAVFATNTWAAGRGRDALKVQWEAGANASISTQSLRDQYRKLSRTPGLVALKAEGVDKALATAAKRIDVEYELPFLAHAAMEPLNAVADVTANKCEIWAGTQGQSQDVMLAAAALGMKSEQIVIHTTYLGGAFGRRSSFDSDFIIEAVHASKAVGKPVKVVWSREDDMRGGYYRPYNITRIQAGVDKSGMPVALRATAVGTPVLAASAFAPMIIKDGIDPSSVEGLATMPYAIPNLHSEIHNAPATIPILWWRSVGNSITGFVVNSALDELAVLGQRDPLELRRELLKDKPRHLAVLNKVAELGEFAKSAPAGHARGIALHESFGSIAAHVAEVSVQGNDVTVHRVSCVIDCGLAVNPDQVIAQMQSCIVYGLSAALRGEITIEGGVPQQSNFNDYPVVRMNESPQIDVAIINSGAPLGGVGEPGLPGVAPAVCNAIFAATGKRVRRLPISAGLAQA